MDLLSLLQRHEGKTLEFKRDEIRADHVFDDRHGVVGQQVDKVILGLGYVRSRKEWQQNRICVSACFPAHDHITVRLTTLPT